MPRISASTVAQHVAQQEAAVLRAAARLFNERGFASVTMGDIAAEVGLARSSLYRYFADKDHLLAACLHNEIDHLVTTSHEIAGSDDDARTRLQRWLTLQFDYATDPDHQLFADLAAHLGGVTSDVQASLAADHQRLYATAEDIVTDALAEAGRPPAKAPLLTSLVVGLLRGATAATPALASRDQSRRQLRRSALAVLDQSD